MRTHLAGPFLVALSAVVACSHTEPAPATTPPPPLATCVVDAWLDVDGSCNCPSTLLTTPECGAADCKESNALVLRPDGTSADLLLRRSEMLATFSAIGGAAGF